MRTPARANLPPLPPTEMRETATGGKLRIGNPGNRGGGRQPTIVRDGLRKDILATQTKMRARLREMQRLVAERADKEPEDTAKRLSDQERLLRAEVDYAEFCAKYGLGTTITETDTEGRDKLYPGRLTPDERRAAVIDLLANKQN